jgi:hypothetical protein
VKCLTVKAKLLYECMVMYNKEVPSSSLDKLITVDDFVTYFEAPPIEYGWVVSLPDPRPKPTTSGGCCPL